jgi:hypothetical protein
MRITYNDPTDSLGVFFTDEVPSPLFEEDYEPGLMILSDEAYHFVGVSILDASEQMPANEDPWSDLEVLAWLDLTYPSLLDMKQAPNKIRLNERAISERLALLESFREKLPRGGQRGLFPGSPGSRSARTCANVRSI